MEDHCRMKLPVIDGKEILLRPITDSDTANVVKWRNNPKVRENFIFRDLFTPESNRKWMQTKVDTGQVVQYIIEIKGEKPIGSVYYRDISKINNSAEFGIFIGDDAEWGKGYGTEAARLFISLGFRELHLHRIFLRALESNHRAIRSYKDVGFVQEGVFHDMVLLDGKYQNIVFMAVINNEQ